MWQASLAQAQADAARDANNAFYWFNLGATYNALGEYDKAATAFDQALALGLPWRMLWYQFGPYEMCIRDSPSTCRRCPSPSLAIASRRSRCSRWPRWPLSLIHIYLRLHPRPSLHQYPTGR